VNTEKQTTSKSAKRKGLDGKYRRRVNRKQKSPSAIVNEIGAITRRPIEAVGSEGVKYASVPDPVGKAFKDAHAPRSAIRQPEIAVTRIRRAPATRSKPRSSCMS
jgi:hypothetical protein